MTKYSVVVVGLGQIGMGYDYEDYAGEMALTHCSAFKRHPGFNLLGGVDKSAQKRARFEHKFGLPAHETLGGFLEVSVPDVIVVAVPTQFHGKVFEEALSCEPRLIVCEKPLSRDYDEARHFITQAANANVSVFVNHILRYEPSLLKIKALIDRGGFGKIYKGNVWYAKGLLNNGSHFVDLLAFLFGEMFDVRVFNAGRLWADVDPEPDFQITCGNVDVVFRSTREEEFSFAQMELVGEKGLMLYSTTNGAFIRNIVSDPLFPGYKILGDEQRLTLGLDTVQLNVVENLYAHLTDGEKLRSDGESALATLSYVREVLSCRSKLLSTF